MAFNDALAAHLATGTTTVCHAWAITRGDGVVLGFTDHDRDLSFDGVDFRAGTGLTAMALQQETGLSVDNSEAIGALSEYGVVAGDAVLVKGSNSVGLGQLVDHFTRRDG